VVVRAAVVAALTAAAASASSAPIPVVTGTGDNSAPVAAEGWLAWMHSATPNPLPPASHTVVLVRRGAGPAWRANPRGTYAQTGGIDGRTLVIQLIRGGTSKLAEVDLRSRTLKMLPFDARTSAWLWRPSASGRRLLYGRIDYAVGSYGIVLADRFTGRARARRRRRARSLCGARTDQRALCRLDRLPGQPLPRLPVRHRHGTTSRDAAARRLRVHAIRPVGCA
jgi:hypothetical protein